MAMDGVIAGYVQFLPEQTIFTIRFCQGFLQLKRSRRSRFPPVFAQHYSTLTHTIDTW